MKKPLRKIVLLQLLEQVIAPAIENDASEYDTIFQQDETSPPKSLDLALLDFFLWVI